MAELNNDIFQYAKDLAKAEKELQIDKWMGDVGTRTNYFREHSSQLTNEITVYHYGFI